MRRALDWSYKVSGVLAALSLAMVAIVVLAQIAGRFLGFSIPSANEISGFLVAASASLGLAPTMQRGGHIRVSLAFETLSPVARRWVEIWCLIMALAISVYFTRWLIDLTVGSYHLNDISPGIIPIPLYIPQGAMTLGFVLFCICIVENLWVTLVRGETPAYQLAETAEIEGEI